MKGGAAGRSPLDNTPSEEELTLKDDFREIRKLTVCGTYI